MKKILIGADNASAQSDLAKQFQESSFPVRILIENLAPRNFSFPELGIGLLRSALSRSPESKAVVTVKDFDSLKRAMTTVEQIAGIHGYKAAVSLELADAHKEEPAKAAAKPATKSAPASKKE